MKNKRNISPHQRRTKRRDVFQELLDSLRSQPRRISLPAPPGTVPPARWVPVRQAAQWRREIARDLRKGKRRKPSGGGGMTLREFAEREYGKTNDICLGDDMQLVRLVGVAEDPYDLYYIEQHLGGERRYASAVCRCDSLLGALRADLYERIERMFRINGSKPVRQMLILRETRARKSGSRVISRTPINMTGKELLEEMRAVARGEQPGPRMRTDSQSVELSPVSREVLEALSTDTPPRVRALAKRVGRPELEVSDALGVLYRQGYIRMRGQGKNARPEVVPADERWTHTPEMRTKLERADDWMRAHPPKGVDTDKPRSSAKKKTKRG